LTCPVIARHGEELTRFGLEAVLELACKRFSSKICRVECVVDYERGARVWERLRTGKYLNQTGGEWLNTVTVEAKTCQGYARLDLPESGCKLWTPD
jgi:hypothetical protein